MRQEGWRWARTAMRVRCSVGAVGKGRSFGSLQVGSNDFDQIRGALGLLRILFMGGIDDVIADVVLEQFGGQPGDGAPDRGDQHQHVGAAELRLQSPLDGFELPPNAPNPPEKLRLVFDGVRHGYKIGGYPILVNP